ncbi:hypothetical protein GJ744_005500 [Endocarpon pusillum]|uniref:BTB domain-containing protein n=1 Tax=Endocarpon pusillum TaxID=364733 RepID=A0A8H7A8N4_9EURO|nr:hypothetical protein GJ744_005500 [Endocarpon pusillum]
MTKEMLSPINKQKNTSLQDVRVKNSTYYYNKQLLRTGAFADCTVTCKGRSWPAHRNVLSPRCDFFKCCFDGRFTEGQTRVIVMEDDDPVAVDGMLFYLYTLDYPVELDQTLLGTETSSGSDSGIEDEEPTSQDAKVYWGFDLSMYTIADKYGLTELRDMAEQALLGKADLAGKEQELVTNMDGFVALLEDLYGLGETSDQMSQLRTQIVSSTCEAITHHVRNQRILALISDVPEFAVELVEAIGKKREERRMVQREEDKRQEAARVRRCHVPMNEESDLED